MRWLRPPANIITLKTAAVEGFGSKSVRFKVLLVF
jgi:hypothetical protein